GLKRAACRQGREVLVDELDVLVDVEDMLAGVRPHYEIFLGTQVFEDLSSLWYQGDAHFDDLSWRPVVYALVIELHDALGDLAPPGRQQPGDGLQRSGLASAVGPEEGHHAPFGPLQREPLAHQDDVAIDDLDFFQCQHGAPKLPPPVWWGCCA